MRKKIIPFIVIILLLFAGIIALTQEAPFQADILPNVPVDEFTEYEEDEETENFLPEDELIREIPEWVKPVRWFRSNAGGMPLEEIPSRLSALRNEYALVIDFADPEELPEYLINYYDNEFFIEIRTFFKNAEEVRTQWIFRDNDGEVRVLAVFNEPAADNGDEEHEDADENMDDVYTFYNEYEDTGTATDSVASSAAVSDTDLAADLVIVVPEDDYTGDIDYSDTEEKIITEKKHEPYSGFIEIIDENYLLTEEYRFFDDGSKTKIEYYYNKGIVIRAVTLLWEENDEGGNLMETHTDFFRYNRSSSLRAVERVFHRDQQILLTENTVLISFPANILAAARNDYFISEKLNAYPEIFGDIFVSQDSKLIFTTDERGRIITQTLKDDDDNNIWVIQNTWLGERIVSISKTEGDIELLSEYEYDSGGNRISERNFRNGVLERLVRTEGNVDIEQLYLNGVVILQAVWEDGRKISETRVVKN